MIPNILDATKLSLPERYYVTLRLPAFNGGYVHVTAAMNDGILDSGDIMVHLPAAAFVANSRDMQVIF